MIVWHRPNPAVGALGDKYRPCTSYITVATRDSKRWFDLTAVRTEPKDFGPRYSPKLYEPPGQTARTVKPIGPDGIRIQANAAGAPPLDCWFDEWDGSHDTWTQTTQPSSLAHYAMWPAKLAERLILSMCPAEVCTFCREPRRRIERNEYIKLQETSNPSARGVETGVCGPGSDPSFVHGRANSNPITLGWTDCGCGVPFTPGTVLDPFAGTFTTGLVAEYHGRNAIGIDLDPRNADLVPLRREEVRRNLNPTHVRTDPAQLELFGAA